MELQLELATADFLHTLFFNNSEKPGLRMSHPLSYLPSLQLDSTPKLKSGELPEGAQATGNCPVQMRNESQIGQACTRVAGTS